MKINKLVLVAALLLTLVVSASVMAASDVVAVKGASFVNTGGPADYKVPSVKTDTRSGYSDYFVGWDTTGTWIDWEVNVPAAGDYVLVVRYATHNSSDVKRSVAVRLADGDVYASIPVVDFVKGGDYGRAEWLVKVVDVPVTLKAGKNIVRMESLPTDQDYTGMNIVNFAFIPVNQLPANDAQVIELVDSVLY